MKRSNKINWTCVLRIVWENGFVNVEPDFKFAATDGCEYLEALRKRHPHQIVEWSMLRILDE